MLATCVYIGEMTDDIDMLLWEYYRWLRSKTRPIKPTVNYYLIAKYLEGKTTPRENNQVAGMMVDDETVYELIRVSKMEMLYSGGRYCGVYV